MNLTISGHHLEVTPALREYVLTKLDRDDHPADGFLAALFSAPRFPALLTLPALLALPLLAWRPAARWLRRTARKFAQEDAASLDLDVTACHSEIFCAAAPCSRASPPRPCYRCWAPISSAARTARTMARPMYPASFHCEVPADRLAQAQATALTNHIN